MGLVLITPVARNASAFATAQNINPKYIVSVSAASADDITNFPTALSKIVVNVINYNQEATVTYLSASSVATVNAAIAAAQSGVLGSGVSAQVALVAGTKAITIAGLTTTNKAFVQLVTPDTVADTVQYKAVCTTNTLTITALIAAGTINVADISTVNYAILG